MEKVDHGQNRHVGHAAAEKVTHGEVRCAGQRRTHIGDDLR
jgi:hypothetical protein